MLSVCQTCSSTRASDIATACSFMTINCFFLDSLKKRSHVFSCQLAQVFSLLSTRSASFDALNTCDGFIFNVRTRLRRSCLRRTICSPSFICIMPYICAFKVCREARLFAFLLSSRTSNASLYNSFSAYVARSTDS
jgi:hypothetical protein